MHTELATVPDFTLQRHSRQPGDCGRYLADRRLRGVPSDNMQPDINYLASLVRSRASRHSPIPTQQSFTLLHCWGCAYLCSGTSFRDTPSFTGRTCFCSLSRIYFGVPRTTEMKTKSDLRHHKLRSVRSAGIRCHGGSAIEREN